MYIIPDLLNPLVIIYIMPITVNEPNIAEDGIKNIPILLSLENVCNKTIDKTAPRAPPAETPINPGSANGFRNNPWRVAPATPSAAPTKIANATLGARIFKRTSFSSKLKLLNTILENSILKLPLEKPTKQAKILVKIKAVMITNCFELIKTNICFDWI